jgi:hypothetical protein
MKKTKYIHVALVTAALASCKPSSFSSRSCPVPILPEDSTYSPEGGSTYSQNQDSIVCLEYERAYFNGPQVPLSILYSPCPAPVPVTFFGHSVHARFSQNLTNFIVRGGFGGSFAKVAS